MIKKSAEQADARSSFRALYIKHDSKVCRRTHRCELDNSSVLRSMFAKDHYGNNDR